MITIRTTSPTETHALGQRIGSLLAVRDVVCLTGDLGAGKTLLVQGLVQATGSPDKVVSPTFTLLNVYSGPLTIYHFDLYRLEHISELWDIGFDEYVGGNGAAVIEWADKFPEALPAERLWIEIAVGSEPNERLIKVSCQGERYQKYCKELA